MLPVPKSAQSSGRDVTDLLRECEPLIVRLVQRRVRGRLAVHRDDVCQCVRLHMWQHSLPRFDPARGPLLPYATTCIDQVITRELRKLDSRPPEEPIDFDLPALDSGPDRDIEELAHLILSEPQNYVSDLGAAILRAVVEHPDEPRGRIAERLGIDVRTVWNVLDKVRRQISQIVSAKSDAA